MIREAYADKSPRTTDFEIAGRIFTFDILPQAEAGYINVYGRDETEHRRDEEALRASEQRYHSLFDKMNEGFALHEIIYDKKGVAVDSRFLEVNAAFEELSGLKREAVIGHGFTEMLPKDDHHFIKVLAKVARTGKPIHYKDYMSPLNKHYDVTAFSAARGQFAVLFTDVSEELEKQAEMRKLNRTLKALSNASQAMMQAADEAEYLKEICRIIVHDCGYRMTWIGYSENDREKSVRPVAHAGLERGYTKTLRVTWADKERGRGPTGTAIRTGKTVICPNMLDDTVSPPGAKRPAGVDTSRRWPFPCSPTAGPSAPSPYTLRKWTPSCRPKWNFSVSWPSGWSTASRRCACAGSMPGPKRNCAKPATTWRSC